MKIGYVSKFLPEKDGGAIYAERLCEKIPCKVVRIGDLWSDADYKVNLRALNLGKKLAEIAEKEKLDLLHVQYVPAGQYFGKYTLNMSLVLAMKQKIPVVITFAEVHTDEGKGLREIVLRWLQKMIATRAAAVIAHTPKQAEYLGRHNRKNFNINMGLIQRKLRKRKDKKIICFGFVSPGKGIEYLMRAMDYLSEYKLLVAGKPTSAQYEKSVREAAKGRSNISIDLRWVPEDTKSRYYNEADIVALPYVWAPYQSGPLHDAMSFGQPVVITKTGGIWEIVEKYGTGIVVHPKNPKAMAEAVKKVSASYGKFQQGIRRYQKDANWGAVGRKHFELYKKILKN
ncbi:MAG: glycosyltransferase [Candidatus Woesearchaeota archaeon]